MELKKTEIIALVNLLGRLSESLNYYQAFIALEEKQEMDFRKSKMSILFLLTLLILVANKYLNKKPKNNKVPILKRYEQEIQKSQQQKKDD